MQDALAKQLGQQVKALRLEASYTQEKLAQETGLSPRGIQKIEAGETSPKYETLFKITESLNADPSLIVTSLWEFWQKNRD